MRSTRALLLAVAVTFALLAAGCTSAPVATGETVTVATADALRSSNAQTVAGNTPADVDVAYLTNSSFVYYNAKPKLVRNTSFGSYRVVSNSPLTVTYTVNSGVTWSDGTAVDAADMLLAWASGRSRYNGTGVNFHSVDAGGGLDLVKAVPKISNDGRSITLVYSKPFVDWRTAFEIGVPAHVTYRLAYPGTSPSDAKAAVISAIQHDKTAVLAKIALAWSTGFELRSMPANRELLVSDGAYTVTDFTSSGVTLSLNQNYSWGAKPSVSTIRVRFIPAAADQATALATGSVDVVSAQASAESVAALTALSGVTVTASVESTFEHVDLTFDNHGPFDAASYGGDRQRALAVRQAFLATIPRQQILDTVVHPVDASAALDNSQTFLPGAPGYASSVANNGSARYSKVDIPGAKALLAAAGVRGPVTVRIAYSKDSARRVQEFALIAASASQAGFTVVDGGAAGDNFVTALGTGSYDASIFSWQFTGTEATASEAQLKSSANKSVGNYNGYSNAATDRDWEKIEVTPARSAQIPLLQHIDANAWNDGYGVTLYQFPDVTAVANRVHNVVNAPLSPSVFWNFWQWTASR